MTGPQLAALQEYVSATCYFMLRSQANGEIHRFLAARDKLELAFGRKLPHGPTPPGEPEDTPAPEFPDILDTSVSSATNPPAAFADIL
jgi:hypothetical protein